MDDHWTPRGDFRVDGLRDRRVLVTGALGWMGRWVHECLWQSGATLGPRERADWGSEKDPERDLTAPGVLERILDAGRYAAVVHMVGATGRSPVGGDPVARLALTKRVIDACAEREIRLLYASTVDAAGDRGAAWVGEDRPPGTRSDMFGASCAWAEEYARIAGVQGVTALRLCEPYGPGLDPGWHRSAATRFLWLAHNGWPMEVHEGATVPLCYAGDTAMAIGTTLAAGYGGRVINIGGEERRSMLDVARLACEIVGAPESLIVLVDPPERSVAQTRHCMTRLAWLGWTPQVDLWEGMRRTYDALRASAAGS